MIDHRTRLTELIYLGSGQRVEVISQKNSLSVLVQNCFRTDLSYSQFESSRSEPNQNQRWRTDLPLVSVVSEQRTSLRLRDRMTEVKEGIC